MGVQPYGIMYAVKSESDPSEKKLRGILICGERNTLLILTFLLDFHVL